MQTKAAQPNTLTNDMLGNRLYVAS
jgi:hypothetical protein